MIITSSKNIFDDTNSKEEDKNPKQESHINELYKNKL